MSEQSGRSTWRKQVQNADANSTGWSRSDERYRKDADLSELLIWAWDYPTTVSSQRREFKANGTRGGLSPRRLLEIDSASGAHCDLARRQAAVRRPYQGYAESDSTATGGKKRGAFAVGLLGTYTQYTVS